MRRPLLTPRSAATALILVGGLLGVFFAGQAGGFGAALPAGVAVVCALGLLLWVEPRSADAHSVGQAFDGALLALPGALVVYFAFDSGGYFPTSPAFASILLIVVLVLRVTLVDDPFAAFSRRLALAAGALGLLAVWTLMSGIWSDAAGRALTEFDRAFMYLLLLVLLGSVVRTSFRLRVVAGGLALGIVVVAVAALATRLYPDTFTASVPTIGPQTLTYPVTYGNALGILCTLGGVLALFFTTSLRQPRWVRAVAAGALPLLAVAAYFTQSRGAVVAGVIGVAAYLLLGRPRGALTGLFATVPVTILAVVSADRHELLTGADPTSPAAASQGHEVAAVLGLCMLGAVVFRVLLSGVDERLERFSLPDESRRRVQVAAWGGGVVAVLVVALAVGAPGRISAEYERFVESADAGPGQTVDESFFDLSNRGLLDNWRVGLEAFADKPLTGHGAGTYEVLWYQDRPAEQAGNPVVDGHSLYVEALAELGAIGFILLAIVVASILAGLAPLHRGPHRSLYAALFATVLAWVAHAGVDWDWEMPVVTASVFALGGAGLARHSREPARSTAPQGTRVLVGALLLVSAVVPALVFASQERLNESVDALRAGNCSRAIDRAGDSIEALAVRAEPYEVIGLCQAKAGRTGLAIQAMAEAVERDPDYWRYHYALGVLRGSAGLNPYPALRAAQRLNPHEADLNALLVDLRPGEAVSWDIEIEPPRGATAGER